MSALSVPNSPVNRVITLSAAVLVLLLGYSYRIEAETLEEAMQLAKQNNPELSAQRARLGSAESKIDESKAGWWPKVHIDGSAGTEKIDTDLSSEFGGANLNRTLNPHSVGVVVEQNLYNGGKTSASVNRDEQNLHAEQARLMQTEQQVLLAAAIAYLDVMQKQSVLELEQHNAEMLDQQLTATRFRAQAGELTPTDVYQAQARLAQAKARLRRAEANLAEARAAYVRHVGRAPVNLTPVPEVTGLPQTLDEALQQARENHPQLKQARYAMFAAQDNIDAVRAGGRPTLTLVGTVQHSENDAIFTDRTDTQRIMLNANVPIYSGGANNARTHQAEQLVIQRQSELDALNAQIIQDVTAAWEAWQAAKVEVVALREQRHASEEAMKGVKAEQRAGARTVLDVLNAQQELLNAQVGVASAKRDLQVDAFQLRVAIGNLNLTSLDIDTETTAGL